MRIVLETGDVVFLRSGSPPMTVTALNDEGTIANVRWFEDETSYRDVIPVVALISAEQVEADKSKETPRGSNVRRPSKTRASSR